MPSDRDPGALIAQRGRDHGLLLYLRRQNAGMFGDWLMIAPPLVIDEAGCDELLTGLSATLEDAASELQKLEASRANGAVLSVDKERQRSGRPQGKTRIGPAAEAAGPIRVAE